MVSSGTGPGEMDELRIGPEPCADGEHKHRRGWPWVAAAVVLCPCHLPLTIGLVSGALGLGGALTRSAGWLFGGMALAFGLVLWRAISAERERATCASCRREA